MFLTDDRRITVAHHEVLSNIITGRAGGGPFEIYASTIQKLYFSCEGPVLALAPVLYGFSFFR
jgi:hypothetical protein